MTVLELIERARQAQREHDRRIDVQLALFTSDESEDK